jgi:hypothetical protein
MASKPAKRSPGEISGVLELELADRQAVQALDPCGNDSLILKFTSGKFPMGSHFCDYRQETSLFLLEFLIEFPQYYSTLTFCSPCCLDFLAVP